jgi:chitodextrinase
MLDSGIRRFDFDIEGHQLPNSDANGRRARVLARLQARYPDLYVSMSLPGWLNGFDGDAMNLLRTTVSAGVRIDMVNVMAMSFGQEQIRTMVQPATVGQAAVVTFRAAANQMTQIFPGRSTSQLHNMMGITPMVGKNDDGSTMTLGDAQTIADFVRTNGIGLIAYWSFQRDRAQSWTGQSPIEQYSGVTQSTAQYHSIFNSAFGWGGAPAVAPAPAPAPTPVANNVAAAPSSCNATPWVNGRQYSAGSVVSYEGKTYTAKYANPGYTPTISTYFWAESSCNGAAAAPVVAQAPAAAQSCQYPDWSNRTQYAAGNIVRYDGNLYRAKFANPGYTPTISTYFWASYNC